MKSDRVRQILQANMEEAIKQMAANLDNYQVCGACDAVLSRSIGRCPVCAAYRFDDDWESVLHQLHVRLKTPLEDMVVTLPRF